MLRRLLMAGSLAAVLMPVIVSRAEEDAAKLIDGREVWTEPRTPGIVGQPVDPYWLFWTPQTPAVSP